jgi:peptide/nickel transport system substrate-binding protein
MKRFRWQILVAVAGVVAILLLLLAVKGPVLRPNAPAVQAVRGGTYREALVGSLQRLNPLLDSYNQADHDVDRLIFSGLIGFDSSGSPKPDLAEGWVISDDGLSYTVILRRDATWHDGQPVTSRDVLYTFSLLQDKNYPGPADLARMWRSIKVTTHDERTVVFTLPEPFAPFLDFLSQGILPEHLLKRSVPPTSRADVQHRAHRQQAFRLDHLIVSRNASPGWCSPTRLPAKGLLADVNSLLPDSQIGIRRAGGGAVMGMGGSRRRWSIVRCASSLRMFSARSQDGDRLPQPSKRRGSLPRLARSAPGIVAGHQPSAHHRYGALRPGGDRLGARLAGVVGGRPGDPARGLRPAAGRAPAGGDRVETAHRRHAGMSYVRQKDEKPLEFTLVHSDDAVHTRTAQMLQAMWAEVGVRAELQPVPAASLVRDYLTPRSYAAVLADLSLARFPDPDPYAFWHQTQISSGQNYSQLDDRSISEVLEIARTEVNLADRAKLYRSFQYRFNYQIPALVLWYPTYSFALDARLNGIRLGPLVDPSDRLTSLAEWYLISAPATPETVSTP